MNLRSLFHRGKNLLQVGKAVQAIKNADGEEAYQRAQNYLMETLGKPRGLPTKNASLDTS